MKKQFIVANWKSHKTLPEATQWLQDYQIHHMQLPGGEDKHAIVCPQFPALSLCQEFIHQHHLPLALGSQDISQFPEGAYTGAVSAKLLQHIVQYSIIGHSERRQYFHESLEDLAQKVIQALSVGITPIYCVSKKEEKIPQGVTIVAFEPIEAIGSGKPDDPQEVEEVARFIKQENSVLYVLYGGSVTPENVAMYTTLPSINGVLVGGASLAPDKFAQMIQHA